MNNQKIQVRVFKDGEALSWFAAMQFVNAATRAVKHSGRFTVALTGGSSPERMYEILANEFRDKIPWESCFIFWGDERWVPLMDKRSNAGTAYRLLLDQVPVPKGHIFPMWADGMEPQAFAGQYMGKIEEHFSPGELRFDLVLLGMGADGHTASLFPHTAVLQESKPGVAAYYLSSQQMFRITLNAPLINQAKEVIFILYGKEKAKALKAVLFGEPDVSTYPSQLIRLTNGTCTWLVDKAAFPFSHIDLKQEKELIIDYVQNDRFVP